MLLVAVPLVVLLPPLALQRLELSLVPRQSTPQRVPSHQDHSKDFPRHALAFRPAPHSKKICHCGVELAVLFFVLTTRHRCQRQAWQGLASCHPALQIRWRCGVGP